MAPCKRLVLVLLVLLVLLRCFSNTAIEARSLGVGVPQIKKDDHSLKVDGDLNVDDEEHFMSTVDLVAMDYTQASKKPPIHN
ncbi:hypothetical protein SDJN03_02598, partial [Cucurbita argyrosperma subsp. sororia]